MNPIKSIDFNVAMHPGNMPQTYIPQMILKFEVIFKEVVVDNVRLKINWSIEQLPKNFTKLSSPQYDIVAYNKLIGLTGRLEPDLILDQFQALQSGLKSPGQAVFIGAAADLNECMMNYHSSFQRMMQKKIIPFIFSHEKFDVNQMDEHQEGLKDVQQAIHQIAKHKLEALREKEAVQPAPAPLPVAPQPQVNKTEEKPIVIKKEPEVVVEEKEPEEKLECATPFVIKRELEKELEVGVEEKEDNIQQQVGKEKIKELNEKMKTPSRFVHLLVAGFSHLIAAVSVIAVRIFLPKVKEAGAVGIGFMAGLSSFLIIDYFRNRKVHAYEVV